LSKATAVVVSGDNVYLQTGDYGGYEEEDVFRTDFVTYQAVEDATVYFDYISIRNDAPTNSYLKFIGLNIQPDWRDPCLSGLVGCDDPQYPESTQSTYAKTGEAVYLINAKYVQVIDSKLEGQSMHLTSYGVSISGGSDIAIDHCEITKVQRGVNMMSNAQNITVSNNHIHGIGASAIVEGGPCSGVLIEGNHAHDSHWYPTEDYAPRAVGQNYHGSAVAIRNGNITIRNNIFHDGFLSAGMMTYNDGSGHFDNVTIENNLLYDISTTYVLRFYLLGDNVNVKNNTFVGQLRTDGGGEYRYNTALAVHSLDTDGTPHLNVSNNIFIGAAYFGEAYSTQNNNIFYSWANEGGFQSTAENGSVVLASNYWSNATAYINTIFSCGSVCNFNFAHGETMNYTLASTSPAVNFGDSNTQLSDSLGSIGTDGFIINNGLTRDETHHSVGAYEYNESTPTDTTAPHFTHQPQC
jgi:hypothetical protein